MPYGTFGGSVYAEGREGNASCTLTDTSNNNQDPTFTTTIPFKDCGMSYSVLVSVDPVNADGKRVGPVIERPLVRNPDWTVTLF
jgi:hypothetical protein